MIYTDGSHITADTEKELHEFAKDCGMNRNWYQAPGTPNAKRYSMFGNARKLAMRGGMRLNVTVQYVGAELIFEWLAAKMIEETTE